MLKEKLHSTHKKEAKEAYDRELKNPRSDMIKKICIDCTTYSYLDVCDCGRKL